MRVGAYPGTFDPPTVAHLAVAEAALDQGGLDAVELVVSRLPLGKAPLVPSLEDRLLVLARVAASRPWLSVAVTENRLIADVVAGYEAVVMGTDKWTQVMDPAWYGDSVSDRDAAVASLPRLLLAVRGGDPVPAGLPAGSVVLSLDGDHGPVSSTSVRAGRREWMAPEAAEFDALTGAWSEPGRYRPGRHRAGRAGSGAGPAASLSPMPGPDTDSQE